MLRGETLAFLQCVLPSSGYYCAVIFDAANPRPGIDRPRQVFVSTIEELTDVLLAADATGRTGFHACASFRDRRGAWNERRQKYEPRGRANVLALRSLFGDIDAGEGKPYSCAADAADAALDFSRDQGLPDPVFVGSGAGIHCYWPFDRDLEYAEWHAIATGFKQAALAAGLQIDPTRTADASSILRPPGTHNRKHGENLLVRYDPNSLYQSSTAPFARYSRGVSIPSKHADVRALQPAANSPRRRRITDSVGAGASHGTVYADTVADACHQLAAFRESGDLLEPTWYAGVGVLAYCTDGEIKVHEWSKRGYDKYSYDETQTKFERARTLTGATTCAKFNDVNPNVCPGCPHWGKINSPISVPPPQKEVQVALPSAGEPVAEIFPPLPEGFAWSKTGQLLFNSETAQGELQNIVVTNYPVFLSSVQTAELDRTSFAYAFKHWLPKKGWTEISMGAATLFGSSGIAAMFGKGCVIHEPKYFLKYVRHQVDQFHTDHDMQTAYDQFGWKQDDTSFLFGNLLYTPAGTLTALCSKEAEARTQWLGPKPRGSLAAWTDAADNLFAADMEGISAGVLSSFAAVLMKFQSPNEGGAIIHLLTPESGKGKTTALTGAWTVWGVREGLSLTNDDTRVSKHVTMGVLGNLPIIYDELRDKDPEVIRSLVVSFTDGRDRMRGAVDGTIRHTKATWQTVMLSASNKSLIEQLESEGTDAPGFRVLELSADLPDTVDKTKGDRWRNLLIANAGHAGDAYLRYLMQPEVLAWAKAALEQWTKEIWDATKLDSAHRFRVRLVGAIAVASALVNQLDILHFQTTRILDYLIAELKEEHHKGAVSGVPPLERALNLFGEFINWHIGETLVVAEAWRPKAPHSRPIVKPLNRLSLRYELGPQRVFIAYSAFVAFMAKKGASTKETLAMLRDAKILLERPRNMTLSAGTDIPGVQVKCLEADASSPIMSGLLKAVQEQQQEAG